VASQVLLTRLAIFVPHDLWEDGSDDRRGVLIGAFRCKALRNFSPCCGQTGWNRRHQERIDAIKLEAAPRYDLQRLRTFATECPASRATHSRIRAGPPLRQLTIY
jgi:hypothetical protein